MSLKDKMKTIFVPSRYKSGTAYSFRGGDFTFVGGAGTYIGSDGLMKTGSANIPRLDYLNNPEPGLLIEPAKTNLIPYSNPNTWSVNALNRTTNAGVAPDGTTSAPMIWSDGTADNHYVYYSVSTSTTNYTFSIFVKPLGNPTTFYLYTNNGAGVFCTYDLQAKTTSGNAAAIDPFIDEYPNGWYRVGYSFGASGSTMTFRVYPKSATTAGDGTDKFLVWGGQLEVQAGSGNYAVTSHIPTNGATATRSLTHAVNTINSHNSGTFYLNFKASSRAPIVYGAISGATGFQNAIIIENSGSPNALVVNCYNGGTSQISFNALAHNRNQRFKVAVTYQSNEIKVYINGRLYQTDTSATIPALTGIGLGRWVVSYNSDRPAGTIYEAMHSEEVLCQEEAEALTAYDDYEEMVDRNGLTWEASTITNNRLSELAAL